MERSSGGVLLAQANIAFGLTPLDDPAMHDFRARLDEINELAERDPGFVWRLTDEAEEARAAEVFGHPHTLINLTVWRDLASLEAFVYRSAHVEVMRERSRWFGRPSHPPFVLWWQPADERPTIDDAKRRLRILWDTGPCPDAFTFRQAYPAEDT